MAKDLSIAILIDFYGQLLSERQYNVLDMYYNQDLSLSEIADEIMISRQGVRDLIKRGEKQLAGFEEKLGLVKRFSDISDGIAEMNRIIDKLPESEEAENLKDILKRISHTTDL